MQREQLEEIEIPGCYRGRVFPFNEWRLAIAAMTGVSISYRLVEKPVRLTSEGPEPAPQRLPVVEAIIQDARLNERLQSRQRLGNWEDIPPDPLLIILMLTVPGGVVRHKFADAIAQRLNEMIELMYVVDNDRSLRPPIDPYWMPTDLGRFTESMGRGMLELARSGTDSVILGQYEPSGWWGFRDAF